MSKIENTITPTVCSQISMGVRPSKRVISFREKNISQAFWFQANSFKNFDVDCRIPALLRMKGTSIKDGLKIIWFNKNEFELKIGK